MQQKNPFYALRNFHNTHGDTSENVLFKARRFESSSTTESIHEPHFKKPLKRNMASKNKDATSEKKEERKLERPSNARRPKFSKNDLNNQEIQTLVHCPVILEESKDENKSVPDELTSELSVSKEILVKVTECNNEENETVKKVKKSKTKTNKKKIKNSPKKTRKTEPKNAEIRSSEIDITTESISTFVEHKDSIEITKKKQEAEGPKERFQQPKCIRLYRKPAVGYIKGGSYPLKSCLKKENTSRGNSFMLGAPGSPLFITSNSFPGKRKK